MNTYTMRNLKLLLLFFFSTVISAQAQQDLKVGLILSGGGAKGLSLIHI